MISHAAKEIRNGVIEKIARGEKTGETGMTPDDGRIVVVPGATSVACNEVLGAVVIMGRNELLLNS